MVSVAPGCSIVSAQYYLRSHRANPGGRSAKLVHHVNRGEPVWADEVGPPGRNGCACVGQRWVSQGRRARRAGRRVHRRACT